MKKFTRIKQEKYVSEGRKGCSNCGEVLTLEHFGKQNTKLGYRAYCKYCRHIHDRKRSAETFLSKEEFWHKMFASRQERNRVKYIQRMYKVDFIEAKILYDRTTGDLCNICSKSPYDNKKALAVDHCHDTGKVRGYLCDACNKGLGSFKDNTDFLNKAIKYLLDGH
jgi:hypothetical protein